jgi:basic membrane protein A
MKRQLYVVSLLVLIALLLAACGPAPTPEVVEKVVKETVVVEKEVEVTKVVEVEKEVVVTPTPEPPTPTEPFKVVVIVTDVMEDRSWNQWVYDGAKKLEEVEGIEVAYAEKVGVPDFERVASDYAEQGYDLIVAHTFDYQEPALKVAEKYPDTNIAVVGGWMLTDNVVPVDVWTHENGYLAGMLGALMSTTGKIGLVGGFADAPSQVAFHEAFKIGARAADPEVEILETWTGTWYDVALGYEAATAQMDAGVDYIGLSLSGPGFGVIQAAQERNAKGVEPHVYVIGAFVDMNELAPDTVLTSTTREAFQPLLTLIEAIKDGTFGTKAYNFGMPDGAADLAPYHGLADKVPQDVKDKIEQTKQDIIQGKLVVPLISERPVQ